MKSRPKSHIASNYFILAIAFLIIVTFSLGYLLLQGSSNALITLMQTRMLDISNTAAAMLDGDVLRTVSPKDKGTEGYETIMRTLTYFQDSIDLNYIYCIRDMGDGTFTFGLDPTVEDPGEFGSPIVYTEALHQASLGTPSADDTFYSDAWGSFYSAYSPVFDSQGKVAGIVAVDFSAQWYEEQLRNLTTTTLIVALLSLLAGAAIVYMIIARTRRHIDTVHNQLNDMTDSLMKEMGQDPASQFDENSRDSHDINSLNHKIQFIQNELRTRLAHVHGQAYADGLTGIPNRAAYLSEISRLEEQIQAGEADFAVGVFDLNGLKQINDEKGHECGDEAIRTAADLLSDLYGSEHVYRIGGDEFTVIFHTVRQDKILDSFMRLEKRIEDANHQGGFPFHLAVSKGYAIHQSGESYEETFKRADQMMYDDKAAYYRTKGDRRRSPR